jgi:ribosome recycling factor
MRYDFSAFQKRGEEIEKWFKNELLKLRTGRASIAAIEDLLVDYYGSKSPLKTLASIHPKDARTLLITAWDAEAVLPIEQAVAASGLGVQSIVEKNNIRLIFPELTEERRVALLKVLNRKLEQAKISLRQKRDEVWSDIQRKEREGEISEDEKYRLKDKLQELIDRISDSLEELAKKKAVEIKG